MTEAIMLWYIEVQCWVKIVLMKKTQDSISPPMIMSLLILFVVSNIYASVTFFFFIRKFPFYIFTTLRISFSHIH